jgi:hypothetical protein
MPRDFIMCIIHDHGEQGSDEPVQDDPLIRGTAQESKTALFELFYTSRRMNRNNNLSGRHEEGVVVTPFTLFPQA